MRNMQKPLLEEIKSKALPILKEAHIKKAALFGSYVKGEQRDDSDIDMLIAFPDNATLIDLVRLKRSLENQLKKKIDIVSYNGIYPKLRDYILGNQYPIL